MGLAVPQIEFVQPAAARRLDPQLPRQHRVCGKRELDLVTRLKEAAEERWLELAERVEG